MPAIAEHSICQPAALAPARVHLTSSGSLALAAFHKHEIERIALADVNVNPFAGAQSSSDFPDSLP